LNYISFFTVNLLFWIPSIISSKMPSYLVTGASRGLGYEFIRQIAKDQSNVVIGLVRNKAATDERLATDGISNVTIIEADITDLDAQRRAAAETAKLTGGSLDYLINNAAFLFAKSDTMDMIDLYLLFVQNHSRHCANF
jgi:NAD(P)-dependent dehydrogenase (short-subunit alcohol dehydrogenase family)